MNFREIVNVITDLNPELKEVQKVFGSTDRRFAHAILATPAV